MYDVLGGGFHRYSVDARWLVPHFEKMLYDNALLAPRTCTRGSSPARSATGGSPARRSTTCSASSGSRRAASPPPRTPTPTGSRASPTRGRPSEIEAVLGEPHPEWLQPFEHGRDVIRGRDPRGCARRAPRGPRSAGPSRSATTRRSPRGTASPWPRSRTPAPGSSGRTTSRRRSSSPGSCSGPLSDERGRLLRSYREGDARIPGYLEDYANVANGLVELAWATGRSPLARGGPAARRPDGRALRGRRAGRLLRGRARGGRPRGPAQGVRRPPDPGRQLDGRVRPPSAVTSLRRPGAGAAGRSASSGSRATFSSGRRPPSHTSSARSTSTSRRRREIAVVGESDELRRAALAGLRPNTVFAFSPGPTDAVPLLAGKSLVDGGPGGLRLRELRLPAAGHTAVADLEAALAAL